MHFDFHHGLVHVNTRKGCNAAYSGCPDIKIEKYGFTVCDNELVNNSDIDVCEFLRGWVNIEENQNGCFRLYNA